MDSKGLYVWTNNKNGMPYVGKANVLSRRALQHPKGKGSKELAKAIKEFGLENFTLQLIPYPDVTESELRKLEREKILELGSLSPNGYNKQLPDYKSPDVPTNFLHTKGIYTGLWDSETRCAVCNKRLRGTGEKDEGLCSSDECYKKWWEMFAMCSMCGTHFLKDKAIKHKSDPTKIFCDEDCLNQWSQTRDLANW